MKNRIGFVPKGFRPQPDYYKNTAGAWCAVWLTDDGREFHVQMVLDWRAALNGYTEATGVDVLEQMPDYRAQVSRWKRGGISLREALGLIRDLLGAPKEPEQLPLALSDWDRDGEHA